MPKTEVKSAEPEGALEGDAQSTSLSIEQLRPKAVGDSKVLLAVYRIALLLVVLVVWEAIVAAGWINELYVSRPSKVVQYFSEVGATGDFWNDVWVTTRETLAGFVLGSLLGIVTGLLLAKFDFLDLLLDPFLALMNSIPRIALAPLIMLWFGIGEFSKVAIAVSIVYFIMVLNTRAGVRSVDPDLITIAKIMGGRGWRLWRKVILPGSVAPIFTGLRLSAVYALLGVIVGEFIAAQAGLGQRLVYLAGIFRTSGVMATILVLALMGVALNGSMALIERRISHWRKRGLM